MTGGRMTGWRPLLVVAGLLVALVVVNRSVVGHERLLADGTRVLLPLQPFDPRAPMLGDDMAVTYDDADAIRRALSPIAGSAANDARALHQMPMLSNDHADGYAVFRVDRRDVGHFVRVQSAPTPRRAREIALRVRVRGWRVNMPGDVWYFPEGQAARYAPARYGELRVGDDGTALLTGLYDRDRGRL